jgi:hypothetical protein
VTQASRWLDGLVTAAWLLGLRGDELRASLPEGLEAPSWVDALDAATTREARAQIVAPHVARLAMAVDETRPTWR